MDTILIWLVGGFLEDSFAHPNHAGDSVVVAVAGGDDCAVVAAIVENIFCSSPALFDVSKGFHKTILLVR